MKLEIFEKSNINLVKTLIFCISFILLECHYIREYRIPKNANLESKSIVSDSIRRSYHVYKPDSIPKKAFKSLPVSDISKTKNTNQLDQNTKFPLIIFLHGRYGTGKQAMMQSDFNTIADKKKLIIIYPDGYDRSWADGRGGSPADRKEIDDVRFVEDIIQNSLQEYPIDRSQIFICGHSNGGFLTQRLLLEKTELFRAGASVVSQLSENLIKKYRPSKPISVLFINGTEDRLVPYYGGYVSDNGLVLSAQESFERWVKWNSCMGKPTIIQQDSNPSDKTTIVINKHSYCDNNSIVGLYTIVDGGHSWPGNEDEIPFINLGNPTYEIKGSEIIWKFFESTLHND